MGGLGPAVTRMAALAVLALPSLGRAGGRRPPEARLVPGKEDLRR
jgi:hypothetical protein